MVSVQEHTRKSLEIFSWFDLEDGSLASYKIRSPDNPVCCLFETDIINKGLRSQEMI